MATAETWTSVLEGVGGAPAKRLAVGLLLPAVAFWLVGLGVLYVADAQVWWHGGLLGLLGSGPARLALPDPLRFSTEGQVALLLAGPALVELSAVLVEPLILPSATPLPNSKLHREYRLRD